MAIIRWGAFFITLAVLIAPTSGDVVGEGLAVQVQTQQELLQQVQKLSAKLAVQETQIQQLQSQESVAPAGTVYTRWGRKTCPENSSTLYSGFAGGPMYKQGGGVNYQCLPKDPEFDKKKTTTFAGSYIHGVEYETRKMGIFSSSTQDQNVPCARCYTYNRAALLMIPGKRTCPEGWQQEYHGYLMAPGITHRRATYECVDVNPEYVTGGASNTNGGFLYFVRHGCEGSLYCPPYAKDEELLCAVCTR